MSELFRKAKIQLKNKLPFVIYAKPDSDKCIALFQKNDSLFTIDNYEVSGFAFVSFDNLKRVIIPESESDIYFEKISDITYHFNDYFKGEFNEKDKIDFEKLVNSGIEAIKNNEFEKVVLSRKEVVNIQENDIEILFNRLCFNYKSAFKYLFYHPKVGFWVGATPEQLVKVDDLVVKTVSLAGTQVFDEEKPAVWHQKEQKEQQIVTDYLTEILEKISDNVNVSEPYSQKAGNLVHLKSDLQAKIKASFKIDFLTHLLHPTPAVCGFPKAKAMQFILENENYDREFYTGFVGEWQKDLLTFKEQNSDLFVNLRCMKLENSKAEIFVGCGITKDSEPEKEFLETVNKTITMKLMVN